MPRLWKMYGILVFVMFVWGLNLPLLKYLLSYVQPVTMTGFRLLLAAVTVFLILWWMKAVRLPSKREWLYIVGGAILNVVMHHYFLNMGLVRTQATNAGLILGTGPVLTAVFTALLLKSYPSRLQWLGVFLGFAGVSSVIFLDGGEFTGLSIGDAFIFISILAQVLSFIIIAKAAKTLDPRLLTAYMLLIGSVIMIVIGIIQEPGELNVLFSTPPLFWFWFSISAVFGTAVGHMLYNYSVGEVGPTKAAIFINLNTFFALTGSAFFLGEVLTIRHFIALGFIIIGVIFGSGAAEELWRSKKKEKTSSF